jgi:hypothetical protein
LRLGYLVIETSNSWITETTLKLLKAD